ncbi:MULTISPECIES: DUF885 domain-containing protein [Bradyrhizobium]|uniref:DUF885 domain-containing protein n=1 Tax=Bradyrhizobium TaxID=374 RepID=UPI00155E2F1D|nr:MULTISPECIES: DUF885 domain-containing protein [Bradyrhizobium]MDD1522919.1 DUF885 domain-containing protein [Bradyrhizobium sp. WBAH30]MDD1546889.1 DUF885 domain-containing protein [Bradyrhizobium sp. WBAH41]MDD1560575.1 DUF885 domain-containing protein [Bradyrhizobium sp. WBAH23]MDD1567981.1 DUF885 domain-containing protein [Bradyrhizobium sp. WBAH33]MDD1593961.1 DUF885 domain-containing protein [Bradyrhizobium sp. WBAH42]
MSKPALPQSVDADPQTDALSAFLEQAFERQIRRSPTNEAALLARKDRQHLWDEIDEAAQNDAIAEVGRDLERLRADFDPKSLPQAARLSYWLFENDCVTKLEASKFRHHSYPLNQMEGWQSSIPAFLLNNHPIDAIEDAEAYISRLEGVRKLVAQVIDGVELRARKGIFAPRFVYDKVIRDCRNLLSGVPFHPSGQDSTWLADFRAKVAALPISYAKKPRLIDAAIRAMIRVVQPAYVDLITASVRLEALASTDDGAWKHPDGDQFYALALKHMTTTDLSATEIHEYGLQEVARIHGEMEKIKDALGFDGDLGAFFEHVKKDPKLVYPDTEEGRSTYLREATRVMNDMYRKLDRSFGKLPKAPLVVKRVEAYREESAGLAFYQPPATDGSRPGIYYINLSRMEVLKTFQLEALAYHEGVPGHHMQLAIASELTGVPTFQKFSSYTAYAEGWGLYAEALAKDMGAYTDPMSDFGRLVLELWRATRLVVDTGIHAKRWTRQQAIDYLRKVTPNPESEIIGGVERYIVLPGQATAYKVGMQRLLALRSKAGTELGQAFEIREFHDVVLGSGALPLGILSELVESWISSKTPGPAHRS